MKVIVLFVEDSDTEDRLRMALDAAREAPPKPNPPDVPFGSPQERYTEVEVDPMLVAYIRKAAPKIHWGTGLFVPAGPR